MLTKQVLKRQFAFLEEGYGLKYRKVPADRWDDKWTPSISYGNDKTGVLITYEVRDQFLGVRLHQLECGEFPRRRDRIDLSKGLPLNSVVYLVDPDQRVGAWRDENAKSSTGDITLEEYLSRVATRLRKFADDLLRGDFSRSSEIERATAAIYQSRMAAKD